MAGGEPLSLGLGSRRGRLADERADARALVFGVSELGQVRDLARAAGRGAALHEGRSYDFVTAVNELAISTLAGGLEGTMRIWAQPDALLCEVSGVHHGGDRAVRMIREEQPIAGRRGLWLLEQLCDRVLIYSTPAGRSRVQLWMDRDRGGGRRCPQGV